MRRNCPARTKIKRASALVGVLGAALLASSSANAITTFTWSPSGGGLSTLSNGFSSDNITIKDYAVINLPTNPSVIGSISESGALAFTSFDNPTGSLAGFIPGTHTGGGPGSGDYQ